MSKNIVIAIDGPAGAGKSTVAKHLAQMLDYVYVDTGAMYRAITYLVLRNGVQNDHDEIIKIASDAKIKLQFENGITRVFINGEEVTDNIRTPEVNSYVSEVSKISEVRDAMVKIQRNLGTDTDLIAEGRDTTTIVFPDATIKVFLTASIEERAKRRHKELIEKGQQLTLEEVRSNIEVRDRIDSSREVSPLIKAKDAVEIDSTNMTIPDEIYKILDMIEKAVGMKLRKNI
ncbi:MAG: (d)CMP kinase [Melioribacteraceae bacterium]|nr:MAG: (d)CMP kinase [Melioribacteraceae bacterium]